MRAYVAVGVARAYLLCGAYVHVVDAARTPLPPSVNSKDPLPKNAKL